MRLNATGEYAAVILPCLHHDSKIGKLRCTVINIETVEVVFKNALRSVPLAIPACLINLHQHIKGIDEDMTAAHAGVDDLDVFDIQRGVLVLNLVKLLAYFLRLFRFGQVILPTHFVGNQRFCCNAFRFRFVPSHFIQAATVRIDALVLALVYIDSAKAVFNHIADDPVWGKELCCSRNIVFCDFPALFKDFSLEFGVVKLVQPADDLDGIPPVIFGDVGNHVTENAVLFQNVVRQQKLGIAAHFLKHTGKRGVQGVALRQKQIAIETFGVVALDILRNFLPVQPRKVKVQDITQNLRFECAGAVRKHANMGGQIVVDLHKAQGDKAVEPSVGNLFHDLLIALFLDLLDEFLPLGLFLRRQQPTIQCVRRSVTEAGLVNSILIGTLGNLSDQLFPRPDRKLLNCVLVHFYLIHSFRTAKASFLIFRFTGQSRNRPRTQCRCGTQSLPRQSRLRSPDDRLSSYHTFLLSD